MVASRASAEELLLVHYSDPHVGKTISGGGWVWQATGHEMGALEAFSNALGRIRRMPADHRILVHTGDASAHGHEEQLQLYQTMRDCGLRLHGHAPAGMVTLPAFRAGFTMCSTSRVITISGMASS